MFARLLPDPQPLVGGCSGEADGIQLMGPAVSALARGILSAACGTEL